MEPDISAGLQENQEEDNFSDAENSDDEPEEADSLPVTAELTAGFVPAVVAAAVVFVVLLSVFDAEEVFAGSPLLSVLSSDSDWDSEMAGSSTAGSSVWPHEKAVQSMAVQIRKVIIFREFFICITTL